jgi:V/A-type H+-transporting ATPase subunit F
MKRIVFMTPEDARFGFTMAGVRQMICTPEELEATLKTVLAEPETGLVIVDERLMSHMAEERFHEMEKRWSGILMVMPAPEAARPPGEDYALRLIRRAIGYQVRLDV